MGLKPQMRRPVELHIDELVLHGFEPGDRYRIAEALSRELERLFGAGGAPEAADGASIETIDAGAFRVSPRSRPETIGSQAGRAVFDGLSAVGRRRGQP